MYQLFFLFFTENTFACVLQNMKLLNIVITHELYSMTTTVPSGL